MVELHSHHLPILTAVEKEVLFVDEHCAKN